MDYLFTSVKLKRRFWKVLILLFSPELYFNTQDVTNQPVLFAFPFENVNFKSDFLQEKMSLVISGVVMRQSLHQ